MDFGVLFALLTAYYGFQPDYIYERLSWPQVRMYLRQVPMLEYRRHFPMAKLTATVLNMMGGKPKGQPSGDPIDMYHPHELMPSYAQPEEIVFNTLSIGETAAKEFLRLSREGTLPGWVIALADLGQIRAAAGAEG